MKITVGLALLAVICIVDKSVAQLSEEDMKQYFVVNSLAIRFRRSWFNDEDCGIEHIPLEPLDCEDSFVHQTWSQRREKMERHEQLTKRPDHLNINRISGGEDAVNGQFPWTAMINTTSYRIFCTGSLFTRRLILSSAHCFWTGDKPDDESIFRAYVGVDLPEIDHLIAVEIEDIITHPCYPNGRRNDSDPLCPPNLWPYTYDLAFLVIKPVDIQKNNAYYRFNTICYSNEDRTYDIYDNFLTSGWGLMPDPRNHSQELTPDHLQWVELPTAKYQPGINSIPFIGVNGRSTCPGDSGAPVFVRSCDGRYYQVAVQTSGYSPYCGGYSFSKAISIIHPKIRQWISDVVRQTLV